MVYRDREAFTTLSGPATGRRTPLLQSWNHDHAEFQVVKYIRKRVLLPLPRVTTSQTRERHGGETGRSRGTSLREEGRGQGINQSVIFNGLMGVIWEGNSIDINLRKECI